MLPLPQADLRPLSQVLAVLDPQPRGGGRFVAHSLPGPSDRVYGGQVMAQCLVAASRTLPEGSDRPPHSLHGYFLRMGRLGVPIDLEVEVLHDGGSFSNRRVLASQEGSAIMTFMASFQEVQEGADFQATAPPAPDPESLPSNADLLAHIRHPAAWMVIHAGAFDLRHVDGQIYFPNGQERSSTQMVWMRARRSLPDRTTQLVHRALLAYACDQVMLEPALRANGLVWTTPGTSIASLDHAMWFHRHVDVRDWLLYVQEAPSTQGGRGLGLARVFDRAGRLIATIAQEGMVRVRR
ncbi:MAG TPA: acyl-CoA thioesterase II [Actinomycetales bacterium]|nr:acyl-CoA thioesterase II [Actinomycetales bacterium]